MVNGGEKNSETTILKHTHVGGGMESVDGTQETKIMKHTHVGGGLENDGQEMPKLKRTSSMEARGRQLGGMRKLAPMLTKENVVWLAGGLPHKTAFPMTSVNVKLFDGSEIVIDNMTAGLGKGVENGNLYCAQQYGLGPRGYPPLVDWCESHTRSLHGELPGHKAIIAGGSTAAFDLITRILMEEDNTVCIVEEFSFPGFMMVVRNLAVPTFSAKMDDKGMTADALKAAIDDALLEYPKTQKVVIYMGTCGQNPTGLSYTKSRLKDIYLVARDYEATIIEDDPYMYLNCPGGVPSGLHGLSSENAQAEDRCSMLSIDEDARVVRLDTFSKFVAPGLRAAWLTIPEQYLEDAIKASDQSTRTGATFSHVVLFELLKKWGTDGLDCHLKAIQKFYNSRSEKLDFFAQKHLAEENLATWSRPDCGMFFWMKLNCAGSEELIDSLAEAKVAFGIGNRYVANMNPDVSCPYIRVSFTSGTDEDFDHGMKTLASVLKQNALKEKCKQPNGTAAVSSISPKIAKILSKEAIRRAEGKTMMGHFPGKKSEMTWLATGSPNKDVFPIESVTIELYDGNKITIDNSGSEDGKGKMYLSQQYGQGKFGYPPLIDYLEKHTRLLHGDLPNHKVVMSAGTTSTFDIIARMLMDANDTMCLVEENSFPGFFNTVKPLGVPVMSVPMDEEGAIPSALQEAIAEAQAIPSVTKIVFYIITCGQNPTGLTYRKARLEELYAVVREYDNITIVEDDTYIYLNCPQISDTETAPPGLFGLSCVNAGLNDRCSMLSIDTDERVVRMDTFSKFIAPGLRCAWMTMPASLAEHAASAQQNSTKTGSVFAQLALHEILNTWGDEGLDIHLKKVQTYYHSRAEVLHKYASKHLSGLAEWAIPDGGMFFWIRLKGVDDSSKLLTMLLDERIAVVPGKFFVAEADEDTPFDAPCVRVAFTVATDEQFDAGMERLAKIITEYSKANGNSLESIDSLKTAARSRRRPAIRTPVTVASAARQA